MSKVTLGIAPTIDENHVFNETQFVIDANKKPSEKTGKNVNFYLPIGLIDNLNHISKKNNISKTVILKAMYTAFSSLEENEQNRILFEAIKNKDPHVL